ncbi:hypothetical protein [Paenibacillus sp. TC-CSREp1]|uniref:hypothetical protein n=1 Tax=Paenibacillus sp. TC-CSREp1 TaxID=3410089 RepID=UPI003CF68BA2
MESRVRGAQRTFAGGWALVLSLSSDFFLHRSWRWKSDAKLALAAPSSLSLLVPQRWLLAIFSLAGTHRASSL